MSNTTKTSKMNRIVILNIIGTFFYQAINFILTPVLTRALGNYDFGIVTLYTSWVNLLIPILSLSIDACVSLVVVYIDEKERPKYFTSLIGLSSLSFAVVGTLVLIFLKPISQFLQFEPIVVVMLIIQCFGMMLVRFMIAYCVQHQKTIMQFAFSISVSVLTCFGTLGLLYFITEESDKYLCRIFGFSIPYFAVGLVVIAMMLRLSRNWFCVKAWKFALPICIPFIFHTLSHIVLNQSGKLVLQKSLENGVELAGYYGFAYTLATVMQILWTAFNHAWVPYYYKLLKEDKQEEILASSKRYMNLYTGGFMAFVLISPEFTRIMGGAEYAGADKLVLLLLVGIYFIYLYSFAVNFKTFQKRTASIAVGTIIAAAVNFILCVLLTRHLSYWGSAIAMVVSYLVLLIVHQLTVRDKTGKYNYSVWFFVSGTLKVLATCGVCLILSDFMIIRWIAGFAIGIFLLVKIIKQKRIF
ncbi:MAG: oligosaccharide flippase family protein [Clostridia bacterium]|nr:oligosaccharide flippase family protein [Clostridia bacterium]